MIESKRIPLGVAAAAILTLAAAGAWAQIDPKFVITGPVAAAIGEKNMINIATAEAIAKACVRMAAQRGENAAVVILDNFGRVVYQYRMDGAARYTTVNTAELNARTAYLTRRPSKLRMNNEIRDPSLAVRDVGRGFYPEAGGLPIWAGEQIIGFIGVGNMARRPTGNVPLEWSDEICGFRAMEEVVGRQPPLGEDLPR
jgi:uncharacterized protein GlcG (DUF336 family)